MARQSSTANESVAPYRMAAGEWVSRGCGHFSPQRHAAPRTGTYPRGDAAESWSTCELDVASRRQSETSSVHQRAPAARQRLCASGTPPSRWGIPSTWHPSQRLPLTAENPWPRELLTSLLVPYPISGSGSNGLTQAAWFSPHAVGPKSWVDYLDNNMLCKGHPCQSIGGRAPGR